MRFQKMLDYSIVSGSYVCYLQWEPNCFILVQLPRLLGFELRYRKTSVVTSL